MLIKKLFTPLILLPLLACSQPAQPSKAASGAVTEQPAASADVTKRLTEKLEQIYQEQKLKVVSVRPTPMAGLYEVVVSGNQIVYVDADAKHMLVGEMIDMQSRKSLTEERMADISRIDYAALPLDKAIKEVRGKGELSMVVFSDPDCPYCKKLEQEIGQMDNVTVYTLLMPILSLHPQAQQKSVQLWCQPNKVAAWTQWMRENKAPPQVAECANPVAETMALGEQFGFNGTPTIVFPNGKTQAGYSPKEVLLQALQANQK